MVRFVPGSTGLGVIAVSAGNRTLRLEADCVDTPDAATKVILPLCVEDGTVTTICVADWLTKFELATGVDTALNKICYTRSRSVPVMVRLVLCFTGLGERPVATGK